MTQQSPRFKIYQRHGQGGARPLSATQTQRKPRAPRNHPTAPRSTRKNIRALFDAGYDVDAIAAECAVTAGYVRAHLRRAHREVDVFTRLIPGMAAFLKLPAPLYLLNDGRK